MATPSDGEVSNQNTSETTQDPDVTQANNLNDGEGDGSERRESGKVTDRRTDTEGKTGGEPYDDEGHEAGTRSNHYGKEGTAKDRTEPDETEGERGDERDWNAMEEERYENEVEQDEQHENGLDEEEMEVDKAADDEEVMLVDVRPAQAQKAQVAEEERGEDIDMEYPTIAEAMQIDQKAREATRPKEGTVQHEVATPRANTILDHPRSWVGAASGVRFQTEEAPEYKYGTRLRVEISFDMNDIPREN